MLKSIYLFILLLLLILNNVVVVNCQPFYNCNKLNCSENNTSLCKAFGCSPMFGCFETSVCPQHLVDFCHINSCDEKTGKCIATEIMCDDGNPNTRDFCNPSYGCQFEFIEIPQIPTCDELCNDNNQCTIDFCDLYDDCYHYNRSCSDHNACTIDFCDIEEGCINIQKSCDDNNPCTADFCNYLHGCYHEPIECSIKIPCNIDSDCNRNNDCETFSCDLITNTCDYYAKDCNGSPCINNQCKNHLITN